MDSKDINGDIRHIIIFCSVLTPAKAQKSQYRLKVSLPNADKPNEKYSFRHPSTVENLWS